MGPHASHLGSGHLQFSDADAVGYEQAAQGKNLPRITRGRCISWLLLEA